MHESIASALLKGEMRNFQHILEKSFSKIEYRSTSSRTRWLKHHIGNVNSIPGITIINHIVVDKSKKSDHLFYGFGPIHEGNTPVGWAGFAVIIQPRTCSFHIGRFPLRISYHAMLRVMQRLNLETAHEAIMSLKDTIWKFTVLIDGPREEVLLPTKGGLVFFRPDKLYSGSWTITTFISDEQAEPEQTELAAENERNLFKTNDSTSKIFPRTVS